MNQLELEALLQKNYSEISDIITAFLDRTSTVFSFPSLNEGDRRSMVWTALFQHLQNAQAIEIHKLCLAAIKVLSRDKVDLDKLLCQEWVNLLIEQAGLYHLAAYDEESLPAACFPHKDIIMEALKCLYNISLNSEAGRGLCAQSCLAEGLICRLRIYRDLPSRNEIMLFDMKILFILTALREDFRVKVKELHAVEYLVNCLKEILSEAAKNTNGSNVILNDEEQGVACEILKTMFNLLSNVGGDVNAADGYDSIFLQMAPLLHNLLLVKASTKEKHLELCSNVTNFLTSLPVNHYHLLSPPLSADGDTARHTYGGHNMDAIHVLLELLKHRLESSKELRTQFEQLSAILTVMHKASRGCRAQRKYLRDAILPPLRDVSRPPEQGDALRNHMCRLLTTPVTEVRDLAAEFLFILCKEKVGRMVKYTGFGNAAGLLAQKGLLAGGTGGQYSSSSDDSDTEEYRRARPGVDPVVGCTRPKRADPLEGMSEEQKEYEAMELVKALERLQASGLVRPARAGHDGRLQPLDHVLQLRDHNS